MARKLRRLRVIQKVRSVLIGIGFIGILLIGMVVDAEDWTIVDITAGVSVGILLLGVLIDYLIYKGVFVGNLDFRTIIDWNSIVYEREHPIKGHPKYYKWLKDHQLLDTDHNFEYFCRRYVHKGVRKAVVSKVA